MAEPTVQQPMGRRLGVLVRAVPLFLRRARGNAGPAGQGREPDRPGILSVHLDLAVTDADDAAAALDRVVGVLRPGDRVYLVGRAEAAEARVDERPFTIWA